MRELRPSPRVLTVWRILAALAFCLPAFLLSFFLRTGSLPWLVGTAVWVAGFLVVYLFFLPRYYRSIHISLDGARVLLRGGVFTVTEHIIPVRSIEFTTIMRDPVYRLLGLSSLHIVAPGGRMILPGLSQSDAQALAETLPSGPQE